MWYLNLILFISLCVSTQANKFPSDVAQASLNNTLIQAVKNKEVDKALKLLEEGSDPHTSFSYEEPISVDEFVTRQSPLLFSVVGWTPPHNWCGTGFMMEVRRPVDVNTTLVQKFLDAGAGNALSQKEWNYLLGFAVNHCTTRVVSQLLKSYSGKHSMLDRNYLFEEAITNLRPDTARMVIGPGIKINAKNAKEETLLVAVACVAERFPEDTQNQLDAIRLLLDHGADINAQDRAGRTALMWAVIHRKAELVRLLLDKGANPNLADKGDSVFIWDGETVSSLPKSEKGRTAADFAKGNATIVEMLKRKNPAVSAKADTWP